jgi:hypothetical protein
VVTAVAAAAALVVLVVFVVAVVRWWWCGISCGVVLGGGRTRRLWLYLFRRLWRG